MPSCSFHPVLGVSSVLPGLEGASQGCGVVWAFLCAILHPDSRCYLAVLTQKAEPGRCVAGLRTDSGTISVAPTLRCVEGLSSS